VKLPPFILVVLALSVFCIPVFQAAAAEKIPLILASGADEGDNHIHVTLAKFMDLVEENAPGAFDIQYRPSRIMGDEPETVRLTQSGDIQMAALQSDAMAAFAPSVAWMNMPYFFEDRESFHKAALALWDETNERVVRESGCRIILINEIGFRNLTTGRNHRVTDLDGARELKITAPADAPGTALYQALGLTPVPVNFDETYDALAQGTADGQISAYSLAALKKFYEVQQYALDIETGLQAGFVIVQEKWLAGLPGPLRNAVLEAGRVATLYEFDVAAPDFLARDWAAMKDAGREFLGRPADFDRWRELGRKSWPEWYKIIGRGDGEAGETLVVRARDAIQ
jgi:TRAP-type C4-dicarboxylate transport system substrate-binding protein